MKGGVHFGPVYDLSRTLDTFGKRDLGPRTPTRTLTEVGSAPQSKDRGDGSSDVLPSAQRETHRPRGRVKTHRRTHTSFSPVHRTEGREGTKGEFLGSVRRDARHLGKGYLFSSLRTLQETTLHLFVVDILFGERTRRLKEGGDRDLSFRHGKFLSNPCTPDVRTRIKIRLKQDPRHQICLRTSY